MADYNKLIDAEMWAFIEKTAASYPLDTATRTIEEQRKIYDTMCATFHEAHPAGTVTRDTLIAGVKTRVYGPDSPTRVVFYHGGGFVVGGLDSHDDVCAEIAANTGLQIVSVDYRLSPEHPHPAAYDDAFAVAQAVQKDAEVILVGDSAGGNLAAAVSGQMTTKVKGQVLVYPGFGGDPNTGSYLQHANAPLLTREEIIFYMDIRGGDNADSTLRPLAGPFNDLPPTVTFAAECDPLYDDSFAYAQAITNAGGQALAVHDAGLVHGHFRARHMARRAGESFANVCGAISAIARGQWPFVPKP